MEYESQSGFKVVLVGDSGVGKTSIAVKICNDEFDEYVNETIGSAQFTLELFVDDKKVLMNLWDTVGQEKYSSLVPIYSKGATVGIIVGSIESEESIAHMSNWSTLLDQTDDSMKRFFVINKTDKTSKLIQQITDIKAKYGSLYPKICFVSAKSGQGLRNLFQDVAQACVMSRKADIETLIPNKKTQEKCNC